MKRLCIILITLFCLPCLVSAQSPQDPAAIKKQINAIKLDEKYQKEEEQDADRGVAEEYAFQALLKSVNVSRKEKGLDSLLQKNLRPFVKILSYPRQSMYRGFAYVKISEVNEVQSGIPFSKYFDASKLSSNNEVQVPASTQVVVPDTLQVKETPKVTVTKDTVIQVKEQELHKQKDSVEVPTPTPPTPTPLTPTPPTPTITTLTPSMVKSHVLMSLTAIEVANEAYKVLEEFQKKNSITVFDKMSPTTQLEANDYVIVFDSNRVIQSILQPQGDGKYLNILNKSDDSLNNYRGTGSGALWFRF